MFDLLGGTETPAKGHFRGLVFKSTSLGLHRLSHLTVDGSLIAASVREYNEQSGSLQFIAFFGTKVLFFCPLFDICSSLKKWTCILIGLLATFQLVCPALYGSFFFACKFFGWNVFVSIMMMIARLLCMTYYDIA
jgi:hypothetical protein